MPPRTRRRFVRPNNILVASLAVIALLVPAEPLDAESASGATGHIQHVVILYLENHTFDNVFGAWCHRTGRCNGVIRGRTRHGTLPLRRSPDIVPEVNHGTAYQRMAIDGGKMDHFDGILGCEASKSYPCYTQFRSWQIPN